MAKNKKKVVVTTKSKSATKSTVASRTAKKVVSNEPTELLFGKENYMLMLAGIGLIVLGLFLMSGGKMPSRDIWDESLIYSTRRTLIAPIIILLGIVVEFVAIFRNNK